MDRSSSELGTGLFGRLQTYSSNTLKSNFPQAAHWPQGRGRPLQFYDDIAFSLGILQLLHSEQSRPHSLSHIFCLSLPNNGTKWLLSSGSTVHDEVSGHGHGYWIPLTTQATSLRKAIMFYICGFTAHAHLAFLCTNNYFVFTSEIQERRCTLFGF